MSRGVGESGARGRSAAPGRRGAGVPAAGLIGLIHLYRMTLSPLFAGVCRFEPSCSRYAEEAIRAHGPARGTWLAVRRLLSCRPFGRSGYDPVPDRMAPEGRS